MDNQTKEAVRRVIREANKSILDLDFGCRVMLKDGCEETILYSLGALADVLLAAGQNLAVVGNGCFLEWSQHPMKDWKEGYWNLSHITWDLTKSLEDQSEEVWQFLADLLLAK